MWLHNLIYRLGSRPKHSWAWFLRGLGLFLLGALLLLTQQLPWLDILALGLILLGFVLAVRGYIGIFANRFAQVLNRAGRGGGPSSGNSPPN